MQVLTRRLLYATAASTAESTANHQYMDAGLLTHLSTKSKYGALRAQSGLHDG
jgi:hypothetical protein